MPYAPKPPFFTPREIVAVLLLILAWERLRPFVTARLADREWVG